MGKFRDEFRHAKEGEEKYSTTLIQVYNAIHDLDHDPTAENLYRVGILARHVWTYVMRLEEPTMDWARRGQSVKIIIDFVHAFDTRDSDEDFARSVRKLVLKYRYIEEPLAPFVTFYMRVVMRMCVTMTGDERVKRMLKDV